MRSFLIYLAAATAAAFSNLTANAITSDTSLDGCALSCVSQAACPMRDKACVCGNFEGAFSDVALGCIRDRCSYLNAGMFPVGLERL